MRGWYSIYDYSTYQFGFVPFPDSDKSVPELADTQPDTDLPTVSTDDNDDVLNIVIPEGDILGVPSWFFLCIVFFFTIFIIVTILLVLHFCPDSANQLATDEPTVEQSR